MSKESFLEVVKEYEATKNKLKELSEKLDIELESLGVGIHFQDEETGAVYEIVKPKGTFIPYKVLVYNRTKLDGEFKGSLSKKRAEELGYTI